MLDDRIGRSSGIKALAKPSSAGSVVSMLRRMNRTYRVLGRCLFLLCVGSLPACAQETQFLPEIDAHLTLNSTFRVYRQAKDDREGGDPTQFSIGPSIQLYLKPLIKLKEV